MRLIDANELKNAIHEKSFDSGMMNPIFTYTEVMKLVDNAEPISIDRIKGVVPLDRIKEAREEVDNLDRYFDNSSYTSNTDSMFKCGEVIEILDKLIAESEDE